MSSHSGRAPLRSPLNLRIECWQQRDNAQLQARPGEAGFGRAEQQETNSNIRWQHRRRRGGIASSRSSSSSSHSPRIGAVAPFAGLPLQRYRQLRSDHGGHHVRDRPRHGCSAVRSVLGNRLTRTSGACERLSFFQSDCHSICTHLSGRVCTDRPPWSRTLRAPLGSVFRYRISLTVATAGYALLISGKHTKDSIEPSPRRCDSLECGDRNHCGVCADLGRYGGT